MAKALGSAKSERPQPESPAGGNQRRKTRRSKADRDLWVFERQAFGLGYGVVAGVDEAGRGPWAGPVVAAAAVLPPFFECDGIDDSKLLTAAERDRFYTCLLENAECWAVGVVEVDEIDRVGVGRAARWAMALALQRLGRRLDYLLVDGFTLPEALLPQLPIIKGDRRSISVMAAGILAKVTRDRRMSRLAEHHPGYGFEVHKGYPTPEHLAAMDRFGLTPLHRRSFVSIRDRAALEAAAYAGTDARTWD